jgi:predicted phosphodiesterase
MRLLCISDIHGHVGALSAVLAMAERNAFHKLLVAGDIVFPGPAPLDTWRRLTAAGAIMVQGVSDKALATLDPSELHPSNDHERRRLERMRDVRAELGDLILERMKRLPTHFRLTLEDGNELVLVHGAPVDPTAELSEDLTEEEIETLVGDDPAAVVVCGMSHVPFERVLNGVHVINVGSVGEAPVGGGPAVAHATWIESSPSGITVKQVRVPCDVEQVVSRA